VRDCILEVKICSQAGVVELDSCSIEDTTLSLLKSKWWRNSRPNKVLESRANELKLHGHVALGACKCMGHLEIGMITAASLPSKLHNLSVSCSKVAIRSVKVLMISHRSFRVQYKRDSLHAKGLQGIGIESSLDSQTCKSWHRKGQSLCKELSEEIQSFNKKQEEKDQAQACFGHFILEAHHSWGCLQPWAGSRLNATLIYTLKCKCSTNLFMTFYWAFSSRSLFFQNERML